MERNVSVIQDAEGHQYPLTACSMCMGCQMNTVLEKESVRKI